MQVKDPYSLLQLADLKAQIQRIQQQIRTNTLAQSTTYYEDDNFAFQLDQNGHEIARVKVSEKSKESSQLIETQKKEIATLRKENERIKRQMRSLEVDHNNIKNKYQVLMEYLKPHHLYPIFKKEFQQNNEKSNDIKEVVFKIIEIPIQKETIVEVPVETQRIIWRQIQKQVKVEIPIEKVIEVPIQVERIVEVEKIVQVQRIVQVQKIVYVDRINQVIVERIKEVPVEVMKFIEVVRTVEVPLEIERTVEVQVERIVERIVEVERIVQVEKIVEVQRILEVEKIVEIEKPVEVERVVEVEKIVKVPYEVVIQKVIEKECPIEVIVEVEKIVQVPVEVEKIVQVPVEVEKIVYLEFIHEVEKIVKTEWIDYAEQLNKERQQLLAKFNCQCCNKDKKRQEKVDRVLSQGQSNWLLVEKEQEIIELKEALEFIEEENKKLKEDIDIYSNLYETQLKLNEQNTQKIIQLNNQIMAVGRPSPVNGTTSSLKDYKETPFPSSLTDISSSRIKLLCNHSKKDVLDKLKKYISQITNRQLADNIATAVHQINLEIQSQQRLNNQMKEALAKLQGRSHSNQQQKYNLAINNEMNDLKRQNYQLKLQLNNQQTNNQTQELIQNLTLQLQQEKNSKLELQQEKQSLSLQLAQIQAQLLQTTRTLQSLIQPVSTTTTKVSIPESS